MVKRGRPRRAEPRRAGRTKKVGFYERRTRRKREGAVSAEEEMRQRLLDAVYRTPEEKRLLIEALRVLSAGKESAPRDMGERVKALVDSLGDQLGAGAE